MRAAGFTRSAHQHIASGIAVLFLGGATPAPAQQAAPPAAPVGTVVAERKPVTRSLDFVGRVDAINRVQVRARVTGFLDDVIFKEGDFIREGAPLYRIEKGQFEAAVKEAQGALERAKSAKVLTAIQLQRAQDLLDKQSGTVVARDQALAADQQASGAILQAEAALQTAEINLGYTDIAAPISGKIGRTAITKGNVVSPDTGALTTIVSQDPMYVTFPISQREFMRAQQTGEHPDLRSIRVKLRFADGSLYDQEGVINFVDVLVDRATDTVIGRATVPNPRGGLIDGQLMKVVLEAGTPVEKILVPQAALIADQEGVYVFVVDNGKVAVKRVKPGSPQAADVVIESGLTGGELVVVEGLQNIKPGASVRASPLIRTAGGPG